MNKAIDLCRYSICSQRHAAIVVQGGNIVSWAVNIDKNNPKTVADLDRLSVHAEVRALKKLKNPAKVRLYVARIDKAGRPVLSRPCTSCLTFLNQFRVGRIVYTT